MADSSTRRRGPRQEVNWEQRTAEETRSERQANNRLAQGVAEDGPSAVGAVMTLATADQGTRIRTVNHLQQTSGNGLVQRNVESARQRPRPGDSRPFEQPAMDDTRILPIIRSMQGKGQQLPRHIEEEMEDGLNTSLPGVRIHDDDRADQLAQSLNARAFTTGNDIFFRSGAFQPSTIPGRETLAHELTHVAQQRGPVPLDETATVSRPQDPAEREAESAGRAIARQARSTSGFPSPHRQATEVVLRQVPDVDNGGGGNSPGTEYTPLGGKASFKGDRFEFTLELHVKRDVGGDGPIDTRLLKTTTLGIGSKMAVALNETTLEMYEIVPGVKVELDVNALEATISAEEIDISLFRVMFGVTGALSKDIAGTPLGDYILAGPLGPGLQAGARVEIEGKFEINFAPEDLARLTRMATASRQVAENGAELAKVKKAEQRLLEEQRKLKRLRQTRGTKLPPGKKRQLAQRLQRNADELNDLKKVVFARTRVNSRLRDEVRIAQKALKSRFARFAGKAVTKLGGKLLAKLVPGLNIITTAMDIYEIATTLYRLAKGEIELGGHDRSDGDDSGSQGDAEAPPASIEASDAGAPPASIEGSDAGAPPASIDGSEEALPPEVDISDALDTSDLEAMGISGEKGGKRGPPPKLHPVAAAVVEALRDPGGVGFTARDLIQLNQAIPDNLTSEELEALLSRLRGGKTTRGDVYAVIGSVIEGVRHLRSKEPIATITADGVTERVPVPEGLDEAAPEQAKAPPVDESPEIAAFLKSARETMKPDTEVIGSMEPVTQASLREGLVVRSMLAIRNDGGLVGGPALLIVGNGPDADGRWSVTLLDMPIYDESGRLIGHRPRSSSRGWSFPTRQQDAAPAGSR